MSFSGDLYSTGGATSVLTTKGDMVDFDTARQRFGIGSANQILQVKSSLPSWETVPLADTVLTTQGDVLYESGSGLARLGFGTTGDVLTTKGTGANPVWETPSGGASFAHQTQNLASTFTTISTSFVTVTGLTHTGTQTSGYSNVSFTGSVSANDNGHVIEARITKDSTKIGNATYEGTGSTPTGNYKNFVQTFWVTSDTVDFDFDVLIFQLH